MNSVEGVFFAHPIAHVFRSVTIQGLRVRILPEAYLLLISLF